MADKKLKSKLPDIKRIEVKSAQMREFLDRVKARAITDEDYEIIEAMSETIHCLSQALEDKAISIKRLVRYLFGAPTETAKNVLPETEPDKEAPPQPAEECCAKKPKRKGHGRNGAASYTGAKRQKVAHPNLKSGDPCPLCPTGRVYELSLPSTVIRIVGSAPLQATIYEMSRLRCNLCGEIFTAPAPEEASKEKYDESAATIIALLKYGCGMPFHRLEKLQAGVGVPAPASTQWELVDAAAHVVGPVYQALVTAAAQGELLHNDDTTARILEYLHEQDPESTRTGVFTTGIVSIAEGLRIAIFMTGRNHAGENLEEILKARASGLAPPIQMCDALSRNVPKELKTILANCLVHARRHFVDIVEAFPQECRHVIELLSEVYRNEAVVRDQSLNADERLAFHQKESGPIMDQLKTWCEDQFEQKLVEPNSGLGKAIQYLRNHWKELTRFLHVPKAPLDNNVCERALKLAVRHRSNSLFFKSKHGAHVGDIFMSLIHTCQLAGENPFDYLMALLRHADTLADSPQRWFPWNYRATLNPT